MRITPIRGRKVESISRSFAVLERIGSGPPVSQADLMRDLGIARSTISDLLRELREQGYVARHGRLYVAGPRLLSFVVRTTRALARPEGVREVLADLAGSIGETAIFVLPVPGTEGAPDQVISIEQAESPHELRYVADIGRLFPARTSVAGRVLIAFAPDMQQDALDARQRDAIAAQGYAITEADARGATTLAAPVRDRNGWAMGAVSIIGPAARMAGRTEELIATLKAATARLSVPQASAMP